MGRRAGIASFIGTSVEWYDFYIYGTASALVFGQLFFPVATPAVGILVSFATFWVGFLARPLGGILFGHLGDRIGRKKTLVTTLLLMGVTTVAIGLLPTYASIGLWAPLLLVLLRVVQGLAVGGEWGGAVLIATEHAPKNRGILSGAWAQQGSPSGQILSSLAFTIAAQLPDEDFYSWGWRVPFLASAVLVVLGLVIRLSVTEPPALEQVRKSGNTARFPLLDVLRSHTLLVVLGVFACSIAFSAAYFKNTFAVSWATNEVGFDRETFMTVVLVASITQFVVQPFGAVLASKFDVRRVVTVLLLAELPAMPLMFVLISTGSFAWSVVGMIVATIPHVMFYAVVAGVLAQSFPARVRYTAISLSYGLAGTLLGGTTPMIGQALLTASGSIVPVIGWALATVLMSLFGVRALLARAPGPDDDEPERQTALAGSDEK
ncbi:MHS family MFS transporter [Saccharopolyspora sp. HNM0983]|uniref:Putative proline/betaine transporter n=1 Tax=Saccharopolyspora montiporae TaxID=2781240 RepID=A0A929BCK1_9PSEU|nr:MFS transporter [Saccharopolyspora sp. HNM0983]MBE9375880.1 MHS family MFS transporter [Saccharopolyspora sp. HNM0983]